MFLSFQEWFDEVERIYGHKIRGVNHDLEDSFYGLWRFGWTPEEAVRISSKFGAQLYQKPEKMGEFDD